MQAHSFAYSSSALLLFGLGWLVHGAHSKCDNEFSDLLHCVASFTQTDSKRLPYGVDFAKFNSLVSLCFTRNGCKPVTLSTPAEVYADPKKNLAGCQDEARRRKREILGDPMLQKLTSSFATLTNWPHASLAIQDSEKFAGCNKKVRQEIRKETEQCLQTLFGPGAAIPPENGQQIIDVPLDFILIDEYYSSAVFNMTHDAEICKGGLHSRPLRQCLSVIFNKVRDHLFLNAFERRERLYNMKICATTCQSKLGLCTEEIQNSLDSACQCLPEAKKPFFRNMLKDCYPELGNEEEILDAVLNRNFNFVRSNVCVRNLKQPCY